MKKILTMILAVLTVLSMNTGCASLGDGDKTLKGAGIGTLAGAAVGAAWGAARGDWAKGALIGAGAGAAIGGVTGAVMDKQEEDLRKAGIRAERDEAGHLIVTLSEDSLKFATGKWDINAQGKGNLDKLAGVLAKYPENRLAIAGHTDNTGTPGGNVSLSKKRAEAVSAYLLSQGVPSRCLASTIGFGQDKPAADNATAAGRTQNRRVDLAIGVDEEEAKVNQAAREKRK